MPVRGECWEENHCHKKMDQLNQSLSSLGNFVHHLVTLKAAASLPRRPYLHRTKRQRSNHPRFSGGCTSFLTMDSTFNAHSPLFLSLHYPLHYSGGARERRHHSTVVRSCHGRRYFLPYSGIHHMAGTATKSVNISFRGVFFCWDFVMPRFNSLTELIN